jgi:hypothetical protein
MAAPWAIPLGFYTPPHPISIPKIAHPAGNSCAIFSDAAMIEHPRENARLDWIWHQA